MIAEQSNPYVWNDGVPKAEGRFGIPVFRGNFKKVLGGLSVKSQLAAVGR